MTAHFSPGRIIHALLLAVCLAGFCLELLEGYGLCCIPPVIGETTAHDHGHDEPCDDDHLLTRKSAHPIDASGSSKPDAAFAEPKFFAFSPLLPPPKH